MVQDLAYETQRGTIDVKFVSPLCLWKDLYYRVRAAERGLGCCMLCGLKDSAHFTCSDYEPQHNRSMSNCSPEYLVMMPVPGLEYFSGHFLPCLCAVSRTVSQV